MKRWTKIGIVLVLTVLGYVFVEQVLNMELEPYYAMLLFILAASAIGLFDKQ